MINKQDLKPMLNEYMTEYYREVLLKRAISDPRDGLKPVQKKGLFAMLKGGYTSDKQHVKSAKVVGDVIGTYSPHGDSSAYESLVDMSADWKKNIPLVDFHGANGSLLTNDGPAAYRYCVVGDTLVPTTNGYYDIKDLANKETILNTDNEIDINIYSVDNIVNKSNVLFNSGYHKTKRIITENGYSIEGSYNHPLLTFNENMDFEWKTIENIQKEDYLILGGEIYNNTNNNITVEEAKFLGSMVSKGYISHNQKYYRIGFTNSDNDFITEMKNCFKNIFNINEDKIFTNKQSNHNEVYDVCIYGKEHHVHLKEKYDFYQTSKYKEVPKCVLTSSNEIQSVFLKYLFEGDGYITKKRNTKSPANIGYDSISKKLIYQVRNLLLNSFGILTSITIDKRNENEVYRILINGIENLTKFKNKIGFAYGKQEELNLIISEISGHKYRSTPKGYYIPYVKEYVNKNIKGKHFKNSINSIEKLKENLERFKTDLNNEDYLKIKRIIDCNYFYFKVKDIEESEEKKIVYSIRVNSDCHSFVGGCFINHNTEMRGHHLTEKYLLNNLNENVVDYVSNYDNTTTEPLVLPAVIPYILINGSFGIAAGYASNIPPSNVLEVLDNTISYIKTGIYNVSMPDYPTGGIVTNEEQVRNYLMGNHKKKEDVNIRLRCKTEIKDNVIIIREIPFMTNVVKVVESLVNIIKTNRDNKKPDGIKSLVDESDKKEGVKIVIECKKGYDAETVLNMLLKAKNSPLEVSKPIGLVGCKNEKDFLTYSKQQELLDEWLTFRIETIKRIKHDNITKNKTKLHLFEGQLKVLGTKENLDLYIKILRNGTGKKDIIEKVMENFDIDEMQTINLITNIPHYKLNSVDIEALRKEIEEKNKYIDKEINYIRNPETIKDLIVDELTEAKKDFKKSTRKTQLCNLSDINDEEMIQEEMFDFIITEFNMIKKLKSDDTSQKRGGKGQNVGKLNKGDSIRFTLTADSRDILYFFTNKGKLFTIKCKDIPELNNKNNLGITLSQYIELEKDEKVISILPINKQELSSNDIKLSFVTRMNKIKLTNLNNYQRTFNVIGTTILKEDELLSVEKINVNFEPSLFCCLNDGNGMNIDLSTVPNVEKGAIGSMAFDKSIFENNKDLKIASVTPILSNVTKYIGVITKDGLCKRIDISEFPKQNRGGKGRIVCRLREGDELVRTVSLTEENQDIKITSNTKMITIKSEDIPVAKRPAYGSKAKDMDTDEEILDMIVL